MADALRGGITAQDSSILGVNKIRLSRDCHRGKHDPRFADPTTQYCIACLYASAEDVQEGVEGVELRDRRSSWIGR